MSHLFSLFFICNILIVLSHFQRSLVYLFFLSISERVTSEALRRLGDGVFKSVDTPRFKSQVCLLLGDLTSGRLNKFSLDHFFLICKIRVITEVKVLGELSTEFGAYV